MAPRTLIPHTKKKISSGLPSPGEPTFTFRLENWFQAEPGTVDILLRIRRCLELTDFMSVKYGIQVALCGAYWQKGETSLVPGFRVRRHGPQKVHGLAHPGVQYSPAFQNHSGRYIIFLSHHEIWENYSKIRLKQGWMMRVWHLVSYTLFMKTILRWTWLKELRYKHYGSQVNCS